MSEFRPSAGGLGCATAAATVVPPLCLVTLIGLLDGGNSGGGLSLILLFGIPVAALHVVPLFLPAFVLIAREHEMPWWGAAALGLSCGGLPAFLISGADPLLTALFAGCGLVGGVAFWLTLIGFDA